MRYQISGQQIDIGEALQNHVRNELNVIIQKYADIKFNWHDKNGVGAPYFLKKLKTSKRKNGLLFLPSFTLFQEMTENLKECNHLYLNKYWKLYELINDDKKKLIKFKFLNRPIEKTLKKLWIENTNNKIKFNLLYDRNRSLQKKIKIEQLRKETS